MKILLLLFLTSCTIFGLDNPILAEESTNNNQQITTTREIIITPNEGNGYSGSSTVNRTNRRGAILIERDWQSDGEGNIEYDNQRTRTTRNGGVIETQIRGKIKFDK